MPQNQNTSTLTTSLTLPSSPDRTQLPIDYFQEQTTLQVSGPGWSVGDPEEEHYYATSFSTNERIATVATRGIKQNLSGELYSHAVGDTAGVYVYTKTDGGVTALGDEGMTGASFECTEFPSYFHGTVSEVDGNKLSLTDTGNNDHAWTTDGGILLKIVTPPDFSGTFSGVTSTYPAGSPVPSPFLQELPIAPTLGSAGITTAWGQAIRPASGAYAIPDPGTTADTTKDVYVTVQLYDSTKTFDDKSKVVIAGSTISEQAEVFFYEKVATGATTQQLGLKVRYGHPDAYLFQGGVAGYYLSFDANYNRSSIAGAPMRTTYPVFGSVDGTSLFLGSYIQGHMVTNPMPYEGDDAATPVSPNNGFTLYRGAEITSNTTMNADPTLEANNIVWTNGDVVEGPHPTSVGGHGLWVRMNQQTTTNPSYGSTGLGVTVGGPGVTASFQPLSLQNYNAKSLYYNENAGDYQVQAPSMINVSGPYTNLIRVFDLPMTGGGGLRTLIKVDPRDPADTNYFSLFSLPVANGSGRVNIDYNPRTSTVALYSGYLQAPTIMTTRPAPASSTEACVKGEMWTAEDPASGTNYLYVAVALNTIERVALSAF